MHGIRPAMYAWAWISVILSVTLTIPAGAKDRVCEAELVALPTDDFDSTLELFSPRIRPVLAMWERWRRPQTGKNRWIERAEVESTLEFMLRHTTATREALEEQDPVSPRDTRLSYVRDLERALKRLSRQRRFRATLYALVECQFPRIANIDYPGAFLHIGPWAAEFSRALPSATQMEDASFSSGTTMEEGQRFGLLSDLLISMGFPAPLNSEDYVDLIYHGVLPYGLNHEHEPADGSLQSPRGYKLHDIDHLESIADMIIALAHEKGHDVEAALATMAHFRRAFNRFIQDFPETTRIAANLLWVYFLQETIGRPGRQIMAPFDIYQPKGGGGFQPYGAGVISIVARRARSKHDYGRDFPGGRGTRAQIEAGARALYEFQSLYLQTFGSNYTPPRTSRRRTAPVEWEPWHDYQNPWIGLEGVLGMSSGD